MGSMLSKLVQLKNSTDADVREEPPAAGDFVKKKLF